MSGRLKTHTLKGDSQNVEQNKVAKYINYLLFTLFTCINELLSVFLS